MFFAEYQKKELNKLFHILFTYPLHLVHRARPRSGARVVEEREPCRRDVLSFEIDADGRDMLDGDRSQGRVLAMQAVIIFGLA